MIIIISSCSTTENVDQVIVIYYDFCHHDIYIYIYTQFSGKKTYSNGKNIIIQYCHMS